MKSGTKMALGLGVGAGYVLGRTRKLKLALLLAGGGMTGRLPGTPRELMQQAAGALGSSTELGKITESVRGDLIGAARAAAVTAAANRIEALNDRLQLPAPEEEPESDEEREEPRRKARAARAESKPDEEPESDEDFEDEYDEEPEEDEEPEDEEPEDEAEFEDESEDDERVERAPASSRRRRPADEVSTSGRPRARSSRAGGKNSSSPSRRTKRSEGATSDRAPVRRTGR
jgi:outer membrane biosynthesis protein TonB